MRIFSLDHVALVVSDLGASCRFYGDQLGLSLITRPAFDFAGAWFALGPAQALHLIMGEPVVCSRSHFALQVASIEEVEEFLRLRGVSYRPPRLRPDGAWQIFVYDPDGYRIELTDCSSRI